MIFSRKFITWELSPESAFNFSIKIFLANIIFLFWTLLCCLLNLSSFCICSISWCCFIVLLLHWSARVLLVRSFVVFQLLRECPSVPPLVFQYSVSVPVFSYWACVPCSGAPRLIVFPLEPCKLIISWGTFSLLTSLEIRTLLVWKPVLERLSLKPSRRFYKCSKNLPKFSQPFSLKSGVTFRMKWLNIFARTFSFKSQITLFY